MTKYRLKKQVADIMPGEIILFNDYWHREADIEVYQFINDYLSFLFAKFKDEWFEEIDERWKPKNIQEFFFFNSKGKTTCSNWIDKCEKHQDRYKFGNCFQTKEQAEQARDLIRETLINFNKN